MRAMPIALGLLVFAGAFSVRAAEGVPTYKDLLADCAASSDSACPGQQTALAAQWPKALSGDLPSLRNFAFCLGDGCFGAFKIDPVRACALRIVVAAIGDRPIPADDRDNFDKDCGPLGAEDQQAAKIAARDFVRAIRNGTP